MSPAPDGGTVAFTDGGNPIACTAGENLSSGVATCTTTPAAAGNHPIAATYSGDTDFAGSGANLTQTVSRAPTTTSVTSSLNPSTFSQSVTYTATLSPATDSGTVAFTDGGNSVSGCAAQTLNSGTATCTTTPLVAGSHSVSAAYSGNSDYKPSSSGLTQVVAKAKTTTTLTSSPDPSAVSRSVTFAATLAVTPPGAGNPTGTVAFTDNASPVAGCSTAAVVAGKNTCTVTYPASGSHSIAANYLGDPNFASSASPPLGQTVANCGTSLATCNLASGNLANVNLSGDDLSGTNLSSSNLTGAKLAAANLSGANLTGANLKNANLKTANLSGANLTNANLTGANMSGAKSSATTTVVGVIWSNTTCPDGTNSNKFGGTCVSHL